MRKGNVSSQTTGYSARRSEEHTSELQSQSNLVCRLLLEKKKKCSRIPLHLINTGYYYEAYAALGLHTRVISRPSVARTGMADGTRIGQCVLRVIAYLVLL